MKVELLKEKGKGFVLIPENDEEKKYLISFCDIYEDSNGMIDIEYRDKFIIKV